MNDPWPISASIQLDTSQPDRAPAWPQPPSVSDELLWSDGTGVSRWMRAGACLREWPEPLAALNWLDEHRRHNRAHRWVGYLAYELAAFLDGVPPRAPDTSRLPLFVFSRHPDPAPQNRLELQSHTRPARPPSPPDDAWRQPYQAAVRRVIDFIRAGDIFQANIAHIFRIAAPQPAAAVYRRLTAAAGDWYSALLDYGDFAIISNSPELFLLVHPSGLVTNRPVKGTLPPGPGNSTALLASEKDAAELNMIIDVQRNDLGRVCRLGSVLVTQPRTVEPHPTVLHGVATVQGQLRPGVTFVDLLRATFPCGSVTGAPKIRAMQIIAELEPTRRGPYCGAVGYLGADGAAQFNVAIRTSTLINGIAHIPVGAGIVADSDPSAECDETLVKAQAMLAALAPEPPRTPRRPPASLALHP